MSVEYYAQVGEAWMGLFVRAYSDIAVTIAFDHPPTDAAVRETWRALTPWFGMTGSQVFHDQHAGIPRQLHFTERPADRRPCGVCDP